MVRVEDGATLDLNGHVMTCQPGPSLPWLSGYGLIVRHATVTNGTVRGCKFGIVPSHSVIRGMRIIGNEVGVQLREKFITGNNYIVGNTIEYNVVGVEVQETVGEVLVDNILQDNIRGITVEDSGVTVIGNLARRNRIAGYRWSTSGRLGDPARLIGNRAEGNGTGFVITSRLGEVSGNVATGNLSHGFDVDLGSGAAYDGFRRNIANGNGADGFLLRVYSQLPAGTLSGNDAILNRGYGFHVREGFSQTPDQFALTITGNTAIDNRADLADDTNCTLVRWLNNRFETAVQPCVRQ